MKKMLLILSLSIITFSYTQSLPPKQAYPLTVKQIHSGHSLTDPLFHPWPGQYKNLVAITLNGIWDNIGKSTIPGSPLMWRWGHENGEEGQAVLVPSARHDIADWELLVITEGVPINPVAINDSKEYLSRYVNNAWNNGDNGNGAPTLLWTTWTNIDDSDGPWRQALNDHELLWEELMDHANANLPSGATPVYIIPGHRMMMRLYDDIQLNLVPGINEIGDLFVDTIHLNDLGAYAMAMIHYACVYNESPVGITNVLWPDHLIPDHTIPTPAFASYIQNMVWEIVTNYERTGISGTLSQDKVTLESSLKVFPNPSNKIITIHFNNDTVLNSTITINNLLGQTVYTGNETTIDISALTKGTYVLKVNNESLKFVKN